MARARNIKPGLYKNEDLAECSIWARFIFPGLWMLADREGRLEDRPKRIKGELLPFDMQDAEPLLRELTTRGFILRYKNSDGSFIQILKFKEHQTPHYSEKPSVIKPHDFQETTPHKEPDKPELSAKVVCIKGGSQPPDILNPDSLNPSSLNPELEAKASLSAAMLPDCPHQKILELFKTRLPHLSQCRSWEGDRVQNLRARWRQCASVSAYSGGYKTEEAGLEFWDSLLGHIASSTSLAKGFESDGRTWTPDLPWIVKASNFQKIVDGKYDLQKARG